MKSPPVSPEDLDAVLFDLDGVLTTTRTVQAAAWKRTFEEFLTSWDADRGTRTVPFDERDDYAAYVDGKPRQAQEWTGTTVRFDVARAAARQSA